MKKFLICILLALVISSCRSTIYDEINPSLTGRKDVESTLGKPIKQDGNTYTYIAKTGSASLLTKIHYRDNKVNTF